jgi:hypothetical protein
MTRAYLRLANGATEPARSLFLSLSFLQYLLNPGTIAFILFENISRCGVDTLSWSEFWFMLTSWLGFVGIIVWRGRQDNQCT